MRLITVSWMMTYPFAIEVGQDETDEGPMLVRNGFGVIGSTTVRMPVALSTDR